MTREEAIEILNETQVVYFAPNGKKKVQEALDMAIEALSIKLQDEFNEICDNVEPKTFIADEWYRENFKREE